MQREEKTAANMFQRNEYLTVIFVELFARLLHAYMTHFVVLELSENYGLVEKTVWFKIFIGYKRRFSPFILLCTKKNKP